MYMLCTIYHVNHFLHGAGDTISLSIFREVIRFCGVNNYYFGDDGNN